MIGATLFMCPHARDRMRQAQMSEIEVLSALGPNVLRPDGSLATPLAPAAGATPPVLSR